MRLWKFALGYVKIKLVCARPEKMMNILISEGISMHNIVRESLHETTAIISNSCYGKVCSFSEENGCNVYLLEEGGLPMLLKIATARPMLIATALLGFIALLMLSNRIFFIETIGCDSISTDTIIELLEKGGVKLGVRKNSLDIPALEESLIESDKKISFVDIRQDGVKLTAFIHEVDSIVTEGSEEAPSSIYSNKDCIIVSIVAEDGKAMVQSGNAVKRGQLLISGDITPEGYEEIIKVQSKGEIIGRVVYRFSVSVDKEAMQLVRSGESCEYTVLELFGVKIESETEFEKYETEFGMSKFLSSCGLPLRVMDGMAYELVKGKKALSEDEMKQKALSLLEEKLLESVPKDARIISKNTEFIWQEDGSLVATVSIQTIEKIGYSRYI